MKLNITLRELSSIAHGTIHGQDPNGVIDEVVYDSRLIQSGEGKVFFALNGKFRKGNDFISDAYKNGVRFFVVNEEAQLSQNDVTYLMVKDPLEALIKLAKHHRSKFDIPIITIVGTHGKTIVKEWLGILLSEKYQVVKSPKSYNSKLGVAMSILELNRDTEIAIFEASITEEGEGALFQKLLNPSHGILTHTGDKYDHNFINKSDKKKEYLQLFQNAKKVFYESESFDDLFKGDNHVKIQISSFTQELKELGFTQIIKKVNAAICLNVASFFKVNVALEKGILPDLAMRLESFDGVENSIILNDTYSFDLESFETSLQYLSSSEKGKNRIVLLPQMDNSNNKGIIELLKKYQIDDYQFIKSKSDITFSLSNSIILVVGGRASNMNRIAGQLKLKQHRTKIEINLNAIRKNIHLVKDRLSPDTKCLVMVKANAYGTGLVKVGQYIEKIGADYIGVAYADEGVALRKHGVNCPILVMNVGIDDFQDCINYRLEPSVYSLSILDEFVKMLIADEIKGFPIHLKVDTGMNRLGIQPNEVEKFITILKSQPEITLKGVYSHFAESDNTENPNFTNSQLKTFLDVCSKISERVSGSFIRHMSNSDGVLNFPKSQLDMVRLGLVVYGISNNTKINRSLTSVIKWSSQVAQIKTVKKGETVGYGRAYIAKKEMRIAIIPVGYADGFRRSLGNGKGSVFIKGQVFYTVGNVCMDMIMIDISNLDVLPGDLVEIIGEHQSLIQFARLLDTIPYEVLTSLSDRVHRNYIIN